MVSKLHYRDLHGGPPPQDESWWAAVLAEDEAQDRPVSLKSSSPRSYSTKSAIPRPASSLAGASGMHSPSMELTSVDWEKALHLYQDDETVDLYVSGYNRGGLLVSGAGLQGFVPVSHLIRTPDIPVIGDQLPTPEMDAEQDLWLSSYVGEQLHLKVIECDQERGRVVFSERAALARPGSRNELLHQLQAGDCVQGSVTNITDFGVFVDLGGVEGLVHVSEISWGRVRHPNDVVKLGQQIRVHVISVDRERARVALSLKRLCPNPWETAEARYYTGQVTEAVITSIVPFGAFARLEEGLDGLIHVSEINEEDGVSAQPAYRLLEGQHVMVRVLHVDGARQRLGLSLRLS